MNVATLPAARKEATGAPAAGHMPVPPEDAQRKHATRVALTGNPNTGKTTLFNQLCGLRAKTANFPGTTTDSRIGRCNLGGESTSTCRKRGSIATCCTARGCIASLTRS